MFEAAVEAVSRLRAICERDGCDAVVAAATSAVRDASNGGDFCKAVAERCGVDVRVLSGEEEAMVVWLGARAALDLGPGPCALFDLGGGSTEFVLGDVAEVTLAASVPVGHHRVAASVPLSAPTTAAERKAVERWVWRRVRPITRSIREKGYTNLILCGGTTRILARMIARQRGLPEAASHGLHIDVDELEALVLRLSELTPDALVQVPGADPRRRHTLVPGALAALTMVRSLRAQRVIACDAALRRGLVEAWHTGVLAAAK